MPLKVSGVAAILYYVIPLWRLKFHFIKQQLVQSFGLRLWFIFLIFQFENLGKAVTWETTSRLRRGGFNFGDDICHHLKHRSGIKRLPPSKRFKEGIPIGYYANFCGNAKWHDTEKRSDDKVCCNVKDPWKYFDCKTGKRSNWKSAGAN